MYRKKFIKLMFLDFLIALSAIGCFLLYFYILPQTKDSTDKVITVEESDANKQTFKKEKNSRDSGNTNTKSIQSENSNLDFSGITTSKLENYEDDTMQISITKNELGIGDDKITYYAADLSLTSTGQLKTAFAEDTFGKNLRDTTLSIADNNNALLSISGDSYGNTESGIVVRNGILYRSTTNDAEICVLFLDGTMKIYTPEEFDQEKILDSEVWQAWNFGPSLLDNGSVRESFQTTSYLNKENPRCAIGYVAPGHYKFILVDGRDTGYSRGATMSELAEIMAYEGCSLAYNLDGGKSAAMVYQGAYINQPVDGGRKISDIIYIEKEDSAK